MGNLFVNLPLPVLNGPGASVDVSALGAPRTLTCTGAFAGATVAIEASNDGGVTFSPLTAFQNVGSEQVSLTAAQFLRANVSGRKTTVPFSASVNVGANDNGMNAAALPLPVLNGAGAPVDISTFGALTTFVATGVFAGVSIGVEISEDGSSWAPLVAFAGQGSIATKVVTANFARINVSGRSGAVPFSGGVALGATSYNAGGGGGGSETLAQLTVQAIQFAPIITDDISAVVVPIDSYNPWGTDPAGSTTQVHVVTRTLGGNRVLGLKAPALGDGSVVLITNYGDGSLSPSSVLTLANQASATSADEFYIAGGQDLELPVGGAALAIYGSHPHWVVQPISAEWGSEVRANRTDYRESWKKVFGAGENVNDLGFSATPALLAEFQRTSVLRLTSDAGGNNVTGIQAPPADIWDDGLGRYRATYDEKLIINTGNGALTFKNNDGGSVPEDRLFMPGFVDFVLPTLGFARFIYDPISQVWMASQ